MALDPARRILWLTRAGYVVLACFAFVYFLFLGFPFDRILQQPKIARGIEAFERENGMKVEVGSIRGGWLFNVVATNVKVTSTTGIRRASPQPGEVADEPTFLLDRVAFRPAPLSLLGGRLGMHIDAQAYGGRVSGVVAQGRSSTVVDLGIRNIELAKYTPLATKWQMNLGGQASGAVALTLDADDGAKSTGKIDLAVKNAMIAESNPLGIQKIPKTSFDKGAGAVVVLKDGRAEFQDVGMHGDDLDVTLDGGVELKKKLAFSNWDARASIKTSDGFNKQVVLLDTFLAPGKGTDGVYRYKLTGPVGRAPRAVPDHSK